MSAPLCLRTVAAMPERVRMSTKAFVRAAPTGRRIHAHRVSAVDRGFPRGLEMVWQTMAASRWISSGSFSVVLSHILERLRLKRRLLQITAHLHNRDARHDLAFITSSRSSLCVQRVIGRPDNFGDSHATAKICATWSAVISPDTPAAAHRTTRRGWLRGAGAARCIPRYTANPKHPATAAARYRPGGGSAPPPPQSARSAAPEPPAPKWTRAHNPLRHRPRPTEFLEHNPLLLANPNLCRLPWHSSPPCLTIEGLEGVHEFPTSWNPISVLWHWRVPFTRRTAPRRREDRACRASGGSR